MHQIHRWVGLQQAAPGAFAGMRLAGDQQHAEPVAHAVDLDRGAVVQGGNLAGQRIDRQFHQCRAGAGDRDFQALFAAGRDGQDAFRLPVAAEREPGRAGRMGGAQILDYEAQRDRLADKAVGGRFHDAQPAVGFLVGGRNQHVQWRAIQ